MTPQALIRSALLHGGFAVLLKAVKAHGLPEVLRQWEIFQPEMAPEHRAEVARKLRNIEEGARSSDEPRD